MKHRFIIEPHVDDAYLSLHQHIVDWVLMGDEVTIASVFSGTRNRTQDAIEYTTALGIHWVGYGYDEAVSLIEPFKQPFVFHSYDGLPRTSYLLYAPCGIEHPVHTRVNNWILADFHYLDIPYAYKDRNRQLRRQLLSGHIISTKRARTSKGHYWKCFPDQLSFFGRNSPSTYLDNPEVVLLA
jgi:hypothetical protein